MALVPFQIGSPCCYACAVVAEILGKVTGTIAVPRGADVSLRVAVPRLWMFEGRTVEVELPRNLVCAQCFGGGCSACGNSGAITVRGRGELSEIIQVCLPEQGRVDPSSPTNEPPANEPAKQVANEREDASPRSVRPVTIRIPECGGLPEAGSGATVRGWLFLHVAIAEQPSQNVRLADDDEPLSSSKMLRADVKSTHEDDTSKDYSVTRASFADGESVRPAHSLSVVSTRVAKVPSLRANEAIRDESSAGSASATSRAPGAKAVRSPTSVRWAVGSTVTAVVIAAVTWWMWFLH